MGPSKPLPIDGVIELSFDRFLNPSTVNRQSVGLRDEFDQAPVSPVVTYDPVRRVVTLSNPSTDGKPWLLAGQSYKLILPIPAKEGDFGLRAIDDAGLEGKGAVVLGFFASAPTGRAPDPTVVFCKDVLPVLSKNCGDCHTLASGREGAAAGLVLDTEKGITFAKGRVANATNTGPRSGTGRPAGNFFPVDMPLIDPGNPGNSFLLYKMLLPPPSEVERVFDGGADCGVALDVTPTSVGSALADGERRRLGDYVLGLSMPALSQPLTEAQLERLRLWIAQGAKVEDCTCR